MKETSEVKIVKTVRVQHDEDVDDEEIINEAIHKLQTGRGVIETAQVESRNPIRRPDKK